MAADIHELPAASVHVKMCQRSNEVVARRAARIFGPPYEHAGPHSDDRLREHFRIEASGGLADRGALFATCGDARGEALEDSGRDVPGFAVGMEENADEIALFFRESDEGICLGVDDVFDFCLVGGGGSHAIFELTRGLFGEFSEQGVLVFEVEVEGAGGIASLGSDVVGRDGSRTLVSEEFAPGFKQAHARRSRTGSTALGAA